MDQRPDGDEAEDVEEGGGGERVTSVEKLEEALRILRSYLETRAGNIPRDLVDSGKKLLLKTHNFYSTLFRSSVD